MHGLCVMQGSTVLFFAEGGGGMPGFGFNQTIYAVSKTLFSLQGKNKVPWKEQSKNLSLPIQVQEKQGDAASASSQCEDTLGKMPTTHGRIDVFLSLLKSPYYFFINFCFLNIQGTFSTFMLCFLELWSHCYSHIYKYDTVFP